MPCLIEQTIEDACNLNLYLRRSPLMRTQRYVFQVSTSKGMMISMLDTIEYTSSGFTMLGSIRKKAWQQ